MSSLCFCHEISGIHIANLSVSAIMRTLSAARDYIIPLVPSLLVKLAEKVTMVAKVCLLH